MARRSRPAEDALALQLNDAPARDQLQALRLIVAMNGEGEVVVEDLEGARSELRHPTEYAEIDETILATQALLEDVVTVEDWTGRRFALPESVPAEDARDLALAAAFIRRRAIPVKWQKARTRATAESLAQVGERGAMLIDQQLGMRIFGEEVPFATARLQVPEVEVRDDGLIAGEGGLHDVELLPPDGEPIQTEWKLAPPAPP
jgi:hypothetical protein